MTTHSLGEIQIRDPYLVTVPERGEYLLFGSTDKDVWNPPATGFDCYRSTDLKQWEGPIEAFRPLRGFWSDRDYWAPEVHAYQGRYYMFATFTSMDARRGTQILSADAPEGPYTPWSDGPVTPREWECLDGTLHLDDAGDPWMVYCHEWVQAIDGEMIAQRLSADLKHTVGEPTLLFTASEPEWSRPMAHPQLAGENRAYVTDGPFLHRLSSGALIMLWSSYGDRGYAMGIAHSTSGTVEGPWVQDDEPLWAADGGHGMIARTLGGDLLLTLHQPNDTPHERAVLRRLRETDTSVVLAD
ncbi:glycoside hydrolase family 43 protein [Demequina salsinemoris]|uniref:glycoside hydrolase family 43 protein n=1 Tax=Demequina salsinemoris TaxID=577470 RepID=UPI0007820A76|nr:glycoside hydrolase family 43 protein [Demequina salsinemoris]